MKEEIVTILIYFIIIPAIPIILSLVALYRNPAKKSYLAKINFIGAPIYYILMLSAKLMPCNDVGCLVISPFLWLAALVVAVLWTTESLHLAIARDNKEK